MTPMSQSQLEPAPVTSFIDAHSMQAVQAKWSRLTVADLAQVRTEEQLIDKVAERYSIPHDQACNDVRLGPTAGTDRQLVRAGGS